MAVCPASNINEAARETYGTLGSGRVVYRLRVSVGGRESWSCAKTFAQLRALCSHGARIAPDADWPRIQRPQVSKERWSRPGEPLDWISDDEGFTADATAAARVALATPSTQRAGFLFLETDVLDAFWDLAPDDRGGGVKWTRSDAADNERRRAAGWARVAADASSPALNLADAGETSKDDVGAAARDAAELCGRVLEACSIPWTDETPERLDGAAARLLCGGDGAEAVRAAEAPRTDGLARFSKRRALRDSLGRTLSIRPSARRPSGRWPRVSAAAFETDESRRRPPRNIHVAPRGDGRDPALGGGTNAARVVGNGLRLSERGRRPQVQPRRSWGGDMRRNSASLPPQLCAAALAAAEEADGDARESSAASPRDSIDAREAPSRRCVPDGQSVRDTVRSSTAGLRPSEPLPAAATSRRSRPRGRGVSVAATSPRPLPAAATSPRPRRFPRTLPCRGGAAAYPSRSGGAGVS